MRIFLALGPGDIVGDYIKDVEGITERDETCLSFSGQAVRLMQARGLPALLISSHARAATYRDGNLELRNLPKPGFGISGPAFHLRQFLYAVRLARLAKQFGANLAIIDSGTSHWFMLTVFNILGIPVAVNFHNVRWPHGFEPRGLVGRLIRRLDSWFFRHKAAAAMGCSPECAAQVHADGADALPYFPWTAQFAVDHFDPSKMPPEDGIMRILYVGRVERNKGALDIAAMAQAIRARGDLKVCFDVCGSGGALEELQRRTVAAGLEPILNVRGRVPRADLLQAYVDAHAIIVPTRGDFCEGMPAVCAEAVLAGRPVITSVLSNALPLIGPAIAEATPESIPSYVDAIAQLTTEPEKWRNLQAATAACRPQFTDRSLSYAASMDRLLASVSGTRQPVITYETLFSI